MKTFLLLTIFLAATQASPAAPGARLKELVALEGVRDNQLVGYGLVVGLAGTGDRRQTVFSAQSVTNLLARMGLSVPPTAIQVKNTAAALLTATLPPFAQPGSRIDVTVAAMGDAASLQGGILVMTGLRGPDGQVYAVAQGPLAIGGFVAGGGGNVASVNHPTVGRIPNGAIVEKGAPSTLTGTQIRLQLQRADFTTAARVAEAVNQRFGAIARAENSALVSVSVPPDFQQRPTEFVAAMESLAVEVDRVAKIVVNERTGTIVMGKDIRIAPVAILQGNLTVEVQTTFQVSQPNAFGGGSTQVVPQTNVGVRQDPARNLLLKDGATVEELVRALTGIGTTPRDLIAILQNLKAAGALEAELSVI